MSMSRVAARALSAGRLGAGGGAGPPRRPHRHPLLCPHHRRRERHQAPCAVRESGVTPTRARRPSPPTRRFARLAPFPANPARASRPPRALGVGCRRRRKKPTRRRRRRRAASRRPDSTRSGRRRSPWRRSGLCCGRAARASAGTRASSRRASPRGGRSPPTRSSLRRARPASPQAPPRRRVGGGGAPRPRSPRLFCAGR